MNSLKSRTALISSLVLCLVYKLIDQLMNTSNIDIFCALIKDGLFLKVDLTPLCNKFLMTGFLKCLSLYPLLSTFGFIKKINIRSESRKELKNQEMIIVRIK